MQKKNLKTVNKLLLKGFFYFCLVFLGFAIAKLFNVFPYFLVNKNIDILNLLSLLFSVLIFYFIYSFVDKEKDANSREKDLLINRIEELYQVIKDQSYTLVDDQLHYTTAAAYSKRIRLQLTAIIQLTEQANLKIDKALTDRCHVEIKKLKEKLTDTPRLDLETEEEEAPVKVSKGVIYYSESRRLEVESQYDSLMNEILSLQLHLNRA